MRTQILGFLIALLLTGGTVAFAEEGTTGTTTPPPKIIKPLPESGIHPILPENFDRGPLIGTPEENSEHVTGSTTGPKLPKIPFIQGFGSTTGPKPFVGSATERKVAPTSMLEKQKHERARATVKRSVVLLEAALQRAGGLVERIRSRIGKLTGIDVSGVTAGLDSAQGEIDAGQNDLDAIQNLLDGTADQGTLAAIRDAVKSANVHIHNAMDDVKSALELLKNTVKTADLNH